MKYNKQTMIDGLKRSIEQTEKEIEEYSKPCNRRVAQGRTAHREFLKKKLKPFQQDFLYIYSRFSQ